MDARSPDHVELQWRMGLAQRWHRRRTFAGDTLPPLDDLVARCNAAGERISVVLPALNESETIGAICRAIRHELMGSRPLVDELIVVDSSSEDGTRGIAEAAGARVYDVSELLDDVPVVPGKGEALWRSLSAVTGDIVVWIDSDIRNFSPRFVTGLVAPLLVDPTVSYVKGFYDRPILRDGELVPGEGGRVTELLARPLLAALFPELSGFAQPLAGEYAGRVEVLRRLPFFTGYSVEVGLLIDMLEVVGLDGLAQVDLGERIHRNRSLAELGPIAYAIARTILRRADSKGRVRWAGSSASSPLLVPTPDGLEAIDVPELERPPIADVARDTASDGEATAIS
jgi:glucosyl-3-phosphoglycerate synthase